MEQNDELEINLKKLFKALWKKAWAIALAAVILGSAVFAYGKYTDVPVYSATATMYTRYIIDQEFDFGGNAGHITENSVDKARSLTDTCIAVLNTRTTLEEVLEAANLDMKYSELSGMIRASSVNDTELFTVTVTNTDAEKAALIANTIAQILPEKVAMVNRNSCVNVIDSALVPENPLPNNITKNAAIAAVLGAMLVCAVIVVVEILAESKSYSVEKKNDE